MTRLFELPGTPASNSFPVVEVAMTNDAGSYMLHGAFGRDTHEDLKVGDRVTIMTVTHNDIGGGKPIRFVSKIDLR